MLQQITPSEHLTPVDQNPYEPPRDLFPPAPQPNPSTSTSNRLRSFGLACGMFSVAAFFLLLRIGRHNKNAPWLNDPRVMYVGLAAVAVIFLGGIIGLVTIFVGSATTTEQPPPPIQSGASLGNITIPHGRWIVIGIIIVVLCLLGWLASRDPLAGPAG